MAVELPHEEAELEELLPKQVAKRCSKQRWFSGIVGVFGLTLVIVAVSLHRYGQGLQSKTRTSSFLGLDSEQELQNCFQQGMYYAQPKMLPATERTVELNPELCQERCQGVDGCQHFTFWPDGGCLLSGTDSILKAAPMKYSLTVTGPKYCLMAIEKAAAVIEEAKVEQAGLHEETPAAWDAGKFLVVDLAKQDIREIQQDAKDAAKAAAAQAAHPVSAGVNGTTCAMYPACVAVGIAQGDCCPNGDHVTLGCCNGFPKVAEDVKIAPGTECSKFSACAALNMTGACCPTSDGKQLGCCSSI